MRFLGWIQRFERHGDRPWFPLIPFASAVLDNFVFVLPSSIVATAFAIIAPRRWFILSLATAVGSALGVGVLAWLLQAHGMQVVEHIAPGLPHSSMWSKSTIWLNEYGLWTLLVLSATPLSCLPVIVLSSIAGTSILLIMLAMFTGRFMKYLVCTYAAARAPKLLRFLGMKQFSTKKEPPGSSPGGLDQDRSQ